MISASEKTRPRKGRSQTTAPLLKKVDVSADEPIERQVYRNLRLALMSGLIEPGATLTGRSLAERLGVSVQPVRDALKRLEADGVLEGRPQSGFYLRDLSQTEYAEVTEIRQKLEGLAGRHAAANIPTDVVARLRELNKIMSNMDEPRKYLATNFEIHFTIYRFAERPALLGIIQNLWIRVGPALHHVQHGFDSQDVMAIHKRILDGLELRDGQMVDQAICDDLETASRVIIPQLPNTGSSADLEDPPPAR